LLVCRILRPDVTFPNLNDIFGNIKVLARTLVKIYGITVSNALSALQDVFN